MRLVVSASSVLAALALAGCAGTDSAEPDQDPAEFVTGLVRNVAAGHYDRAWQSLYPGHKRVASRAAYMRCEPRTPFPGEIEALQVVDVFEEPVVVAGEPGKVDSTAVKLRLTVAQPDSPDERFESTFHVVPVEGRWAWVLPSVRYVAYRAGHCLTEG